MLAGDEELVRLSNDIVGGQNKHDGQRVALRRKRCCGCDGGAGIAAGRLKHDIGLDRAFTQLFRHDEPQFRVRDDDRAGESD